MPKTDEPDIPRFTRRDMDNAYENARQVLKDRCRVLAVYQGDHALTIEDISWGPNGVWIRVKDKEKTE